MDKTTKAEFLCGYDRQGRRKVTSLDHVATIDEAAK